MPKKVVFTQEQLDELRKLAATGDYDQIELGQFFGITDQMVRKIAKENNITLIRKQRTYTCVVCNNEFRAERPTAICPECKATPGKCVICGKEFERKHPYTQKTCSEKCRGLYRAQSGISKEGAAKMKQTKLERYGTLDPTEVTKVKNNIFQLKPKKCLYCEKEFIPETPRQMYCKDDHYGICPVCGGPTLIRDFSIGPQACSEKCRIARINATCLKLYGNKDAVNSEHAKELGRQTSIKNWGYEYYMQSPEGKARFRETSLKKFGTENPMQNKDVQAKGRETSLDKYGKEYYSQTDEWKEQYASIMNEKYGGIGLGSPLLRSRIIETNREKYGCDFVVQNEEIQRKGIQTIREKYKVDNYLSSKEHLAEIIVDPSKVDEFYAFKQDPKGYIESHYKDKPPIYTLTHDLGVSDTPIYDALIRHDCKDAIDRTKVSTMEYEMHNFLRELLPNAKILVNDRIVIKPKELDFYLPEYNFAIECNPTLTHNSTFNSWNESDPLSYNYHQLKSLRASDKGVFLMHVFGYEWEHKRPIIKSMISNVLGCCNEKIYARNTVIKEVSFADCRSFLDANHRQGNCSSKIRLGLYHNDELVSVMTFGLTRNTIGKQVDDSENTYELLRFCNKINTLVVGGASKLFKAFLHDYTPDKVISFSDVAHTRGTLYSKLGFTAVNRSDPSYVWVKPYGEVYKNRVSCQKMHLPKLFKDVTEDTIKEKSERVIMIEHGFVQVYDSGTIRWEYIVN